MNYAFVGDKSLLRDPRLLRSRVQQSHSPDGRHDAGQHNQDGHQSLCVRQAGSSQWQNWMHVHSSQSAG